MGDFLNAQAPLLILAGYELSALELIGTLTGLASVWLVARGRISNWPVGLLSVAAFFLLFWQIRLYADALEQVYFFAASLYGWVLWARRGHSGPPRPGAPGAENAYSPPVVLAAWAGATLVAALTLGAVLTQVHLWIPALFPEPAALPWADAATTLASFTAMILMAQRRRECWLYWIAVDIAGLFVYSAQGVLFVAGLYGVYLVLASYGLYDWTRLAQIPRSEAEGVPA